MFLLALDLSTTVCGFAVFNSTTKAISETGFYRFKKEALLDKANELDTFLKRFMYGNQIDCVVIEERLKSFRAGGTNAEAMLKLASFNFLCQHLVVNKYNCQIRELNVNTARKLCFPNFHSAARKVTSKQKEFAFELAIQTFTDVVFPKKIMKSGKRKGEEVFVDEARDIADAVILGTAAIHQLGNVSN